MEGQTLYICQNFPNRIAAVDLEPDWLSANWVEQFTNDAFNEPTTIVRKGSDLYAVNAYFQVTFFDFVNTATQTMEIVKVPK